MAKKVLFKKGHPQPLFRLLSSFQTIITMFKINIRENMDHPIYGAGIRTHDLQYMSLFPKPLD